MGQSPPLPMMAPQIDGLKSPADFWTAMGNQLRASFTVTVTICVQILPEVTGPFVSTTQARLGVGGTVPGDHEFRIAGRVLAGGTGDPIGGAQVLLVETNRTVETNALGRFSFGLLSSGNYTLAVTHAAFADQSKAIVVPGASPTDYDVEMVP